MSVIVELTLPAQQFELGRILQMEGDTSIVLETMVPLGERSVPFFRLQHGRESFEADVREHPAVDDIQLVNNHDGETLYALDWEIEPETFIDGIRAKDGNVLQATGTAGTWALELRFPSHESLSGFQKYCTDAGFDIDVRRVYNPTRPDAGPWYGLTMPQREMLARAVEGGYYSIPRGISTATLAEEFGISDQAVTERLRRAIGSLVSNTLLIPENDA